MNIHLIHPVHDPRNITLQPTATDSKHQVHLTTLRARIILQQTRTEPRLDRRASNHTPLRSILRIKLTHRPGTPLQRRIQPVEEPPQPALGGNIARLRITQPLDRRDADRRIERARAERHALADIRQKQIALDVALQRHVQHARRDVHADPRVRAALRGRDLGEDLAGEAGAAADVEDEGGRVETEELEGAVGHVGLDVLDSGGGGVFVGFGVIVEEIGGAVSRVSCVYRMVLRGCSYRESSGRDMMAVVSREEGCQCAQSRGFSEEYSAFRTGVRLVYFSGRKWSNVFRCARLDFEMSMKKGCGRKLRCYLLAAISALGA